jgi:cytochrome-b5 reductase
MSKQKKQDMEALFPPRPEEPQESDCCGSGCSPCVFDIYHLQLIEWQKQCTEILCNEGCCLETTSTESNKPLLSQIKFSPFQLLSVQQHTHDTFIYLFQAVRASSEEDLRSHGVQYTHVRRPLDIKVGQHLIMRCGIDENQSSILTRAYTPISDLKSSSMGQFEVIIKLYENGKMSKYIQNLKKNDIVEWRGPFGNFSYVPNSYRHLLMLCAGTGIAPMYPIAKSIVEDDSDDTVVHLLFACRGFKDILFRDEMQQLALYWNFSAEIFLSRVESATEDQAHYGECIRKGRIEKGVINEHLAGKTLQHMFVLICGTKSFNKDMINYVKQVGILDERIHLF